MSRLVVCDTGPLIHLSEAGAVHLLQYLGDVLIPSHVAIEFAQNTQGWPPPQWIQVRALDRTAKRRVTQWVNLKNIDPGEAEAMALALQVRADWLLTVMPQHANSLSH